jgi:hypothetical protein
MAKAKLNTDLDRNEEEVLHQVTNASSVLNSGSKSAQSPKKVQDDEDIDIEIDVDVEDVGGDGEEQVEDDTSFSMGHIVSEETSTEEDDEDVQILKSAVKKPGSEEDEGTEEVWVDDYDIFNDKDDFLDEEDYDPEDYYDEE